MHGDPVLFPIFVIFAGAALLATIALYMRQSLLPAYILLGVLIGPSGLGLVSDLSLMRNIAQVGIIFLLFLLGLNLHPQKLLHMFRKATLVTLASCATFAVVGAAIGLAFRFPVVDSLVIGAALMFSSTIIGVKLLPTTVLHHRHAGEIMISVLLLQDLLAIMVMLLMRGLAGQGDPFGDLLRLGIALPLLIVFAFLFERHVLIRLIARFDRIQEYVFLAALGWCLGIAQLAQASGLSYEIGAFIAGVSIAASPIALFIAESLKPLRDFFLVLFFFSIGAGFELTAVHEVVVPAVLLAGLMLALKPLVFRLLLRRAGETPALSLEIGVRLGQVSEFSLLIAFLGWEAGLISHRVSDLIQITTLLTFMASSYYIVGRYPTPVAVSDELRRD